MSNHKQPMWAQAIAMLEQADRLHRQFFQLSRNPGGGPSWEPPIDILESPTHLSILVALPGVASENAKILIEKGVLRIMAQRPMPTLPTAHIRRIEIPHGHFERRIELPPGQFDIEKSTLTDGCLTLTLRKH